MAEKTALCGADCENCGFGKTGACKGCAETGGCPFGRKCMIAECIRTGGKEAHQRLVKTLLEEFNSLRIPGMPQIRELFALNGRLVNLEYPMPDGSKRKLLDDRTVYLGTQVANEHSSGRCFGLAADTEYLLVGEYGAGGEDPKIVLFKSRREGG